MANKFAFEAVRMIGRGSYFCEPCLKDPSISDPVKSTNTPHCLTCGKHHPVHVDCKGKSIVPPPIDYMRLFYLGQNTMKDQEVGIV
jgi:hypothetical protein